MGLLKVKRDVTSMKRFISLVTGCGFVLLLSSVSYGCLRSPGGVPICYLYQTTNTIFVGEVVKSEEAEIKESEANLPSGSRAAELSKAYTPRYNLVKFNVIQNLKNALADSIELKTLAAEITSCDIVYDFRPGEKWIIFALPHKDGILHSTLAIRSDEKRAKKMLAELSMFKESGITSSIFGQFQINYPLSGVNLKGFKVTTQRDGFILSSEMDEYGQFSFPELTAGTYCVRIVLPYPGYVRGPTGERSHFTFDHSTQLYTHEFNAMVKEGVCLYERIRAFPIGLPESSKSSEFLPTRSDTFLELVKSSFLRPVPVGSREMSGRSSSLMRRPV